MLESMDALVPSQAFSTPSSRLLGPPSTDQAFWYFLNTVCFGVGDRVEDLVVGQLRRIVSTTL